MSADRVTFWYRPAPGPEKWAEAFARQGKSSVRLGGHSVLVNGVLDTWAHFHDIDLPRPADGPTRRRSPVHGITGQMTIGELP